MKTIKRVTEKPKAYGVPYVIEGAMVGSQRIYTIKHLGQETQLMSLEQSNKGIRIVLWLVSKRIELFISNTEIEIEYE